MSTASRPASRVAALAASLFLASAFAPNPALAAPEPIDATASTAATAAIDVLWVTSATVAPAGETSGIARLRSQGMRVTVVVDEAMTPAAADASDLVVISGNARPARIGAAALAGGSPIVTWEPMLYDDLGFLNPGRAGQTTTGRQVNVRAPGHALAASQNSSRMVLTQDAALTWTVPVGDAQVVATLPGQPNRAALFAYESGAATASGPAPARRVGLFLPSAGMRRLTAAGWSLWDAAIDWALESEPYVTPDPGPGDARPTWTRVTSGDVRLPATDLGTGIEHQTASLVGDLDGDGDNDFVIAGRKDPGPGIVWYEFVDAATGWQQHVLERTVMRVEAGGDVFDVDADGDLDVVFGQDASGPEMWWWENPSERTDAGTAPWARHAIKLAGPSKHHDLAFGDVDGDGATELVYWNQKPGNGLFVAEIPADPAGGPWPTTQIFSGGAQDSEGLALADIDGDGVADIVGAGRWFQHQSSGAYTARTIDAALSFSRTAVGQLVPGGRPEVVIDSGDTVGPLNWYQYDPSSGAWTPHELLAASEFGHSLRVEDVDGDGNLDVFSAEMMSPTSLTTPANPDAAVRVFYGNGAGEFELQVVATGVDVHEGRVADLDGDGDLDILGKHFNQSVPGVDVWLNGDGGGDLFGVWGRTVLADPSPWTQVFVLDADIDGDGLLDVVTGGWWYRNPGPSGTWERHTIGLPLANVAAIGDLDGDGDNDIIGSHYQYLGSGGNGEMSWARNDGAGNFTVYSIGNTGWGPFLQGVALTQLTPGGPLELVTSWEKPTSGTNTIIVPTDLATRPAQTPWPRRKLSPVSIGEEVVATDMDGDGDTDLMLGQTWLRNDANGTVWQPVDIFTLRTGQTDRVVLADMDGDGDEDAVVGMGHDPAGEINWYERPADPERPWALHLVANIVEPLSVDAADLDGDGDVDIIAGEHNKSDYASSRLVIFENDGGGAGWTQHVVYTGDEHHDGAHLADLDGDDDLDVVSIGFMQGRVVIYESRRNG